jgi:MFS family permease
MALTSHRADEAGLAQGLAFGIMNSAWALGELTGPVLSGTLADQFGDAVPYLIGAALCGLTFLATHRVATAGARPRAA